MNKLHVLYVGFWGFNLRVMEVWLNLTYNAIYDKINLLIIYLKEVSI